MNTKLAILGEMTFLWCDTMLLYHKEHSELTFPQLITTAGIRSGAACALLCTFLLLADDLGLGEYASLFGLLIVGSALLARAKPTAAALNSLIEAIVGVRST